MIRVQLGRVTIGDYVQFRTPPRTNPWAQQWWKVQSRDGDKLNLINKAGAQRTVNCATYTGIKIYKWAPASN